MRIYFTVFGSAILLSGLAIIIYIKENPEEQVVQQTEESAETPTGNLVASVTEVQRDNLLPSQQLYHEALAKKELGRLEGMRELLNKSIKSDPGNADARHLRNTPEDRAYLIEHKLKDDIRVYIDGARDAWIDNKRERAREIMNKALGIFNKLSIP